MSASIAIVTPEGVVIAADSRTSVSDPRNPADETHREDGKLDQGYVRFRIDGQPKVWAGRLAGATYCSKSIDTDFQRDYLAFLDANAMLGADELAQALHEFLERDWGKIETLIAGYTRDFNGQLWLVGDEATGPRNVTATIGGQYMYAIGRNEAFIRLFRDVYVPLENTPKLKLKRLESTIDPNKVTLQGAIDFALFYMELVRTMEKIKNRGNGVGGPVDVGVVTPSGLSDIYRTGAHTTERITAITL